MSSLTLIRGLPTKKKWDYATRLADHTNAWMISADDYFTDSDGVYTFSPSGVPASHRDCARRVIMGLNTGEDVVVCNTFCTPEEMHHYVWLAEAMPVELTIVNFNEYIQDAIRSGNNHRNVSQAKLEHFADLLLSRQIPREWEAYVVEEEELLCSSR